MSAAKMKCWTVEVLWRRRDGSDEKIEFHHVDAIAELVPHVDTAPAEWVAARILSHRCLEALR